MGADVGYRGAPALKMKSNFLDRGRTLTLSTSEALIDFASNGGIAVIIYNFSVRIKF